MARNLWSDRPLGVKLGTLVAAGAVVLAVFALIAIRALQSTETTAGELLASAEVTEDVLMADMMHDAVRGDVLQALVSGGRGDLYRGAVADLAEHDEVLRDLLAEIAGDGLSPEIVAAVEEVTPAVDAYLLAAQQIVTTAGQDPVAAQAAYPAFGQAFSALEDELPVLGDAVATFAEDAVAQADGQRSTAITLALRSRSRGWSCWPCSAGWSPARSCGRCSASARCWPPWPTATCAAPPA